MISWGKDGIEERTLWLKEKMLPWGERVHGRDQGKDVFKERTYPWGKNWIRKG
jgi:hypothetical protein